MEKIQNYSQIDIESELWKPVKKKDKAHEMKGQSLTRWQDGWIRFKGNRLSILGVCIIIFLVLVAIFGPYLSPYDYSDQSLEFKSLPPRLKIRKLKDGTYFYMDPVLTAFTVTEDGVLLEKIGKPEEDLIGKRKIYTIDGEKVIVDYNKKPYKILNSKGEELEVYKNVRNKLHPFGTDDIGRDLCVRVIYGARISLIVGMVSTIVNLTIGVLYGAISGYAGGKTDIIMMRIREILSSIPRLLYVIILMLIFGSGLKTVTIVIGLTAWLGIAKMVRGQILSLKESEYVLAAKTAGASSWRIITKHLIPNTMGIIIIQVASSIPGAIFTEASLSFVGLGISAPQASWGTLSNEALPSLMTHPYKLFYPALAICLTVLAFNFIGKCRKHNQWCFI
ncbi:ABC transporter permease [Sporanaerobacter acetigenes]|uniref:Oligopeptide transport system permease protein n=1 Tax=Sporanaerobacter acetigenes DSM 13106 TaxID=1123281 RepID=A0A1M5Z9E2_9FIRM|nr:ABC transporter permease [Sporanaerobacter acetigenes]SHI20839.1 oligopeptide transport system permease protein [Sporanaerobacter acetigenes DSM 13106]